MLNELKQITHNVIEGEKLADLKFGTVESANPLSIRLNQWLLLSGSMIAIPSRLSGNNSLRVGDTVALLRQSGGQKFYILDKVKT